MEGSDDVVTDEPSGCVTVVLEPSPPNMDGPADESVTDPSAPVVRDLAVVFPSAFVLVSEKSPFGSDVRSHDSPVVGFEDEPLATLPSVSSFADPDDPFGSLHVSVPPPSAS